MISTILNAGRLFGVLFVFGYFASQLLYHTKHRQFYRSTLWVKVMLWIPIFGLFLLYLCYPRSLGALIIAVVIAYCLSEARRQRSASGHSWLVLAYSSLVVLATGLFAWAPYLLQGRFVAVLVSVCFASVLADVFAFFFGNFFGKHHLPAAFNAHKSWEGVVGELFGAFIGVILTGQVFGFGLPVWICLVIGGGAIIGDLANSYVKRREGIKDWSQNIPGHGGYLDRFASLSGSMALVMLFFA